MSEIKGLQPGFLVIENVHRFGGISYKRNDIDHILQGSTITKKYQGEVIIANAVEFEEAKQVIGSCYSSMRKVCINSSLGLICPIDKKEDLLKTIEEIRNRVDTFNAKSQTYKVSADYIYCNLNNNTSAFASVIQDVTNSITQIQNVINSSDEFVLQNAPASIRKDIDARVIMNLPPDDRLVFVSRCRAYLIRDAMKKIDRIEEIIDEDSKAEMENLIKDVRRVASVISKQVSKGETNLQTVQQSGEVIRINVLQNSFLTRSKLAQAKAREEEKVLFGNSTVIP